MQAKKCDRCGKLYELYNTGNNGKNAMEFSCLISMGNKIIIRKVYMICVPSAWRAL